MKTTDLKKELKLIGVRVNSFPDGVAEGFKEIERKVGTGRKVFGLSRGDKSGIVYWACVLANDNEPVPAGCEPFTIRAGNYKSETLSNWRGHEEIIGQTFQKMLHDPKIDPKGYCVEKYLDNGDVECMVRVI